MAEFLKVVAHFNSDRKLSDSLLSVATSPKQSHELKKFSQVWIFLPTLKFAWRHCWLALGALWSVQSLVLATVGLLLVPLTSIGISGKMVSCPIPDCVKWAENGLWQQEQNRVGQKWDFMSKIPEYPFKWTEWQSR